jgi:hypothetical protein
MPKPWWLLIFADLFAILVGAFFAAWLLYIWLLADLYSHGMYAVVIYNNTIGEAWPETVMLGGLIIFYALYCWFRLPTILNQNQS